MIGPFPVQEYLLSRLLYLVPPAVASSILNSNLVKSLSK